MMGLPAGTRVRLAAGGTEMRKGFDKSGSTETSARTDVRRDHCREEHGGRTRQKAFAVCPTP